MSRPAVGDMLTRAFWGMDPHEPVWPAETPMTPSLLLERASILGAMLIGQLVVCSYLLGLTSPGMKPAIDGLATVAMLANGALFLVVLHREKRQWAIFAIIAVNGFLGARQFDLTEVVATPQSVLAVVSTAVMLAVFVRLYLTKGRAEPAIFWIVVVGVSTTVSVCLIPAGVSVGAALCAQLGWALLPLIFHVIARSLEWRLPATYSWYSALMILVFTIAITSSTRAALVQLF